MASANAASSTRDPRDVLTRIAPDGKAARNRASIMRRVSDVLGACRLTAWARRANSANSTASMPSL
jgi:hypothetical protein